MSSGAETDAALPNVTPEVFDQNSIDSFLGFSADNTAPVSGIEALLQTKTVPYERVPMLEVVFDRFVKFLRLSLRNLTSDLVEVKLDRITSVRFGRYLDTVALPTLLGVFKAVPWNNYGIITVDSSLVYALTDVVFGGTADRTPPTVDGRSFSSIEIGMVRKFTETVLVDARQAFSTMADVSFELDEFETNPRFVSITQPQNVVALATFAVEFGTLQGMFDIVLPFVTLEPIRETLSLSYLGDSLGQDVVWRRHLVNQVKRSHVELTAVMHEKPMPLRRVMKLAVGDTLMFGSTPDQPIQLRCGRVNVAQGTVGRAGDHVALQLTTPFKYQREDADI